jgi:translation elongation factor EF-Ts
LQEYCAAHVLHSHPVLQSCLLDQKFVLDDSVTVQQLLKNKAQQLGLPGAAGE